MNDCWAGALGECAGRITREHYISRGIFDGTPVTVTGMPWCDGQPVRIGLGAATVKILCKKHNNALSRFDDEAVRLANFIDSTLQHPHRNASLRVDGFRLEKWALKTATNLAFLGAFHGASIPPSSMILKHLFKRAKAPDGVGLYCLESILATDTYKGGVFWVDMKDSITGKFVAVKFTVNGFQLLASLVPVRADKIPLNGSDGTQLVAHYRPASMVLEGVNVCSRKEIKIRWR